MAYMKFVLGQECESCNTVYEYPMDVDLPTASRGSVFTRKWFGKLDAHMCDILEDDGWIVSGNRAWCPDCAAEMERGGCRPTVGGTSASSLLSDAALAVRLLRSKRNHR